MVCNQCGSQVPDGQLTCPVCGAYIASGNQNVQGNGYQQPMQGGYAGNGYQQNPQGGYMGNGYPQNQPYPGQKQLGMGWFKFIIYAQLFINALFNLLSAFQLFTGAQYKQGSTNYASQVYLFYPALETADKVYGVAAILLAVGAIVVRFMLAGFKKAGPTSYLVLLSMNIVFSLIYAGVCSSILSVSMTELLTPNSYIQLSSCIAMICVNVVYFKNRKHMFVN